MGIFSKEYILALGLSFIITCFLLLMGFIIKNRKKYSNFLAFILIIQKIVELTLLVLMENRNLLTNFSLVTLFIFICSLLYLLTNNKLIYNIIYHFMYIIILILLFHVGYYTKPFYLYVKTLGYFLILLTIISGNFFQIQRIYFSGYVASILSFFVLVILSGILNKSFGLNNLYLVSYLLQAFTIFNYHIYVIILMVLNLIGITFLYLLKK